MKYFEKEVRVRKYEIEEYYLKRQAMKQNQQPQQDQESMN